MTPEIQELIEAGQALYALAEKHCTMAAEYVRWNEREAVLNRWLAAKLGIEGATAQADPMDGIQTDSYGNPVGGG